MESAYPLASSSTSYNIFNLSDEALREKLEFKEEIGFGNWGSVWRCATRAAEASPDGFDRVHRNRLAVKLVHRHPNDPEKSKTTAARVKSLWNEMKIVGSFKDTPHPAIISFYSFIVTPSFAMITMPCHRDVIPVEVGEPQARIWFRFLLSGVEFLHKHGVAHNDIKPANILVSQKSVPILVDFGFAEKYDVDSPRAFHSNLSYGTPEYLSPERARGMPHDTRKSDVWSLGVTFFEILTGRTPFEDSDRDEFVTKQDLERYWLRTLRGKWRGSWKMSENVEALLRRMISPNADLRCTATQAMLDSYWENDPEIKTIHRRSASYTTSVSYTQEGSNTHDTPVRPSPHRVSSRDLPPGLASRKSPGGLPTESDLYGGQRSISKVKSQPKIETSKTQRSKRVPVPQLPPIMASPPTSPLTPSKKRANILGPVKTNGVTKQPSRAALAPLGVSGRRANIPATSSLRGKPSADMYDKSRRASIAMAELSGVGVKNKTKGKENSAVQRVREWERERERLREISRLEEIERERDEEMERTEAEEEKTDDARSVSVQHEEVAMSVVDFVPVDMDIDIVATPVFIADAEPEPVVASSPVPGPSSRADTSVSGLRAFRHSVKQSIDKTFLFYKSPTMASAAGSRKPSMQPDADGTRRCDNGRASWEDEALDCEAKPSTPVVPYGTQSECIAEDNRDSRMALWMKNVERVVEDARENFNAASPNEATLPALPLPPTSSTTSRSQSKVRVPRRGLAANRIFTEEYSGDQSMSSYVTSAFSASTMPNVENGGIRSASTSMNEAAAGVQSFSDMTASPDQSREHPNFLGLHISPVSVFEIHQLSLSTPPRAPPSPSPRLSALLDETKAVPMMPPMPETPVKRIEEDTSVRITKSFDELTSSPYNVQAYPARTEAKKGSNVPDTPGRRRIEGVYDRFLMATSGVKRVGKGYQSDQMAAVHNTTHSDTSNVLKKQSSHRAFYTARRPMPPPVSSEDLLKQNHLRVPSPMFVDELGTMGSQPVPGSTMIGDENNTTATLVRRAFKAFVPSKTSSKRLSRAV